MFIRQRAMSFGRENLTALAAGINRICREPTSTDPGQLGNTNPWPALVGCNVQFQRR